MNTGKTLTFYGLFDEVDTIEIPILQRDYAQGREDENEIRKLFLSSLFQALMLVENEPRRPLDLDFIYGSFEGDDNKVFSVLDGQQRLTTLFLLHWYLAVENDQLNDFKDRFVTESCSRFTYKTRPSTTEFFNALMAKDFKPSDRLISKQICDSQWFYLSWKQDPTIQACLCMLDAIQQMFSPNAKGMYEKLINIEEPFITFQFLDLHSFGLSDELYIKMNARGKPLTIFENFKAKFEQKIQSFEGAWPPYKLRFKDDNVDGYHYFIQKVDTDWADLFWSYRNECGDDNTLDDGLMNFIRLVIANHYLIKNRDSGEALINARSTFLGQGGRLQPLYLSQYEELGCFTQELIIYLIEFLDLIYNDGVSENKITPYLTDNYYYNEDKTLRKIISNESNYNEKLCFYAFYIYVAKTKDTTELMAWLRVIYNLTENTIFNTSEDFNKALIAIQELSQHEEPILNALKNDCNISAFNGAQILEEKIKAHLLLKSQRWTDAIIEIEKHPYFHGQVGFVFNFSGVLGFYQEHKHCKWDEAQDEQYFKKFEKYAKAGGATFSTIDKSSSIINYFWERAVLSKGVYFTSTTVNRFNLLSTRLTTINIERDHSWRRLLRINSDWEAKQEYVKAVFDDPLFDSANIAASLEKICINALDDSDIDDWRKKFIKYGELFKYCNQGFISINNQEYILLGQSQRNHHHSELYTKVLEIELSKELDKLQPFTSVDYVTVRSRDDYAGVNICDWHFNEDEYSLFIYLDSQSFYLEFNHEGSSNFSDALIEVLIRRGFEPKANDPESSDVVDYYVHDKLHEIGDVRIKVNDLCSDLRELVHE